MSKLNTENVNCVERRMLKSIINVIEFFINEYGKILRECDNLVCFMDDFFTQVLFGLKSEMHVTDLNQLVENEMKILNNSWNMLTLDYSKNIISIYKQELIDEINIFKNILQ